MGETLRAAWGDRVRRSISVQGEELVASVWLAQRASQRVVVPAEMRAESRNRKRHARELLSSADGSPRFVRSQLEQALQTLLVLAGRVSQPSLTDDSAALGAGFEMVDATLPARLRPILARFSSSNAEPMSQRDERSLRELCEWIDALLDDRPPRERRLAAWLPRLGLGAALLVLAFVLLKPGNLALGKAVSASSLCSLTPPPRPGQERLSRVTDGIVLEAPGIGSEWGETNFALCTKEEVHPWVTVDLGSERSLSRAVVYNRSDCCWGRGDLPVSIQTSTDNLHFETVATRDRPFSTELPWAVSLEHRKARYVRLYSESAEGRSIVVSELEVYGR